MKLRFASWNVNNRNLQPTHVALLERVEPDILALQEVSPHFHRALEETHLFGWARCSIQEGSSSSPKPPRSRRLACSIFGRASIDLVSASKLPGLDFPERSLVTSLRIGSRPATICSFHIPPGSSWGRVKPKTMESIARWLSVQQGLIIVGMDANAPKTDHPDIHLNRWWWPGESLLLGGDPLHPLQDALRVYLAGHPAELAKIIQVRPEGPLAISHVRGNGRKRTDCRYDFIYCTPEVKIESVTYMYQESLAAGSDHALVIATLGITEAGDA